MLRCGMGVRRADPAAGRSGKKKPPEGGLKSREETPHEEGVAFIHVATHKYGIRAGCSSRNAVSGRLADMTILHGRRHSLSMICATAHVRAEYSATAARAASRPRSPPRSAAHTSELQ